MTTIRPNPLPLQPATGAPTGTAAEAAKLAAQKAFFEIAMGRAPAAQAAAPAVQSTQTQTSAAPARSADVAATERYKRPGSILDIRV